MYYYASQTITLFYFPTPFGWVPMTWYAQSGAIVTPIMIIVGLITTFVAVGLATNKWWAGFGLHLFCNGFFFIMTIGGAVGCKREGCYLAEAFMVAGTWQIAIFEIGMILILLIGLMLLYEIIESAMPRMRFLILSLPAFFTMMLPLAFVLGSQMIGYEGPTNAALYIVDVHRWSVGWVVMISTALCALGATLLLYHEVRRFSRRRTCDA